MNNTTSNTLANVCHTLATAIDDIFKFAWYTVWLLLVIMAWFVESRNPLAAIQITLMFVAVAYLTPRLFKFWTILIKHL
jgi:hypothetical protein